MAIALFHHPSESHISPTIDLGAKGLPLTIAYRDVSIDNQQSTILNPMTPYAKRYLTRAARKTILYIVIVGLAMIILFPIFFLISFSLMSGYEAYY